MSTPDASRRRRFAGPGVVATFAFLVAPFALGWHSTDLMTPLALPGYLIYTIGSAVGNLLTPNYALWVYWLPFLGTCYGLAVAVAAVGRVVTDRR